MFRDLTLSWTALGLSLFLALPAAAQTFDSGSNGSDGALDLSAVAPGTTVVFDPSSFTPPLDPDGDNVYHFTTIQVPTGVTVRLGAERLGVAPVVWLASGPIAIAGTIDLRGENGHAGNGLFTPSRPGAGGYGGGVGGNTFQSPQNGNGPGGSRSQSGGGGHAQIGGGGPAGGLAYGNDFLIPLIGGSGGGGNYYNGAVNGGGGGAGGGALLLASSTSIEVTGAVIADGGKGGCTESPYTNHGGGGSGGAIRLIAPLLLGNGSFSALGGISCTTSGSSTGYTGSHGRIRLEAFRREFTGSAQPSPLAATPGLVFPPASAPAVRVVRVAGTAVPASPTGSFVSPDVTLDGVSSATLEIEARKIPPGTVVRITLTPETGSVVNVNSSPLAGTFEASTATATVTIPHGFSRFTIQASWTP